MEALAPTRADRFTSDLRSALQTASTHKTTKTQDERTRIFEHWRQYCSSLRVSPSLRELDEHETRLCFLLVFAQRYRRQGRRGQPVKAGAVEQALLAVGEGITHMGEPDPRRDPDNPSRHHPVLSAFLHKLRDDDDPAHRAYPVTLDILRALPTALDTGHPSDGPLNTAVIDLCIVAFFWLMRPSEYLGYSPRNDDQSRRQRSEAFRLCDISFTINRREYLATTAPLNEVNPGAIQYASLVFTDQKNAVRGECIGHWATQDPTYCPCKALARLAACLLRHGAAATTPICTYYDPHARPCSVLSTHITNSIRHAANSVRHLTGIDPFLLSARSLRPGGATALLCANVDPTTIQLIGRWKSDAMIRYLRVNARTVQNRYAQQMLNHGAFTFVTTSDPVADPLPIQLPPQVAALTNIT